VTAELLCASGKGRQVVSQFLSGTQTRRIGPLVKQYPEPHIEMHLRLAAKLGIQDGDWTTAETRRGTLTLRGHPADQRSNDSSNERLKGLRPQTE